MPNKKKNLQTDQPLKLVFIHLDLGIGGAEQLVLQLAKAGQQLGHSVEFVTTRCDADHCFAAVAPGGPLADQVKRYGSWLPSNIAGMGTALCSSLRIWYLTWQVCRNHRYADVCIVDVLPTSLPLLLTCFPSVASLFYCHFPDKLLLQRQPNNNTGGMLQQLYRLSLDSWEELTMSAADLLVVNSKFTRETVLKTFPLLQQPPEGENVDEALPVLYPALDTTTSSTMSVVHSEGTTLQPKTKQSPIVSLNRFERKKNILLLLYAYQYLKEEHPDVELPPLIVAGGYDKQNVENVEYRGELERIVKEKLSFDVDFRVDISDEERATLFQTALAVVYTPHKEHFGIVPLEAMYAGTPVLAVQSGGPMETIVDGKTGFLRPPKPQDFGEALLEWIQDPAKATAMGKAGKHHVESTFGSNRLAKEFDQLLQKSVARKQKYRANYALWDKVGLYAVDAIFAVLVANILTAILQAISVLEKGEGIIGGLQRTWNSEEL